MKIVLSNEARCDPDYSNNKYTKLDLKGPIFVLNIQF